MQGFQLQVRTVARDRLPPHLSVGEALVGQVRAALVERPAEPAAVVVVRRHAVEVVDPRPAMATGMPLPWLLAGLAASHGPAGEAEAVGLAGRLTLREGAGAAPVPVATVFLEWSDNRWWHWQVTLDAQGRPVPGTEVVRAADQGHPMPPGLGRWWSAARRQGLRLGLAALASAGDGGVEH